MSLPLVYVAAALPGFAISTGQMPMGISVREAFDNKDFSQKMGVVAAFDYLGVSLAGVILSVFFDATGSYRTGIIAIIAAAAVTALLFFPGTKRVQK